jgi:hypothetical protein
MQCVICTLRRSLLYLVDKLSHTGAIVLCKVLGNLEDLYDTSTSFLV